MAQHNKHSHLYSSSHFSIPSKKNASCIAVCLVYIWFFYLPRFVCTFPLYVVVFFYCFLETTSIENLHMKQLVNYTIALKPILKNKLLLLLLFLPFSSRCFLANTHAYNTLYRDTTFFLCVFVFLCIRCSFYIFYFCARSFSPLMVKLVNGFGLVSGLCVILIFYVWATRKKNALCYVIVVVYVWVWDIAYLLLLLVTSKLYSFFCSFIPRIWKFADFYFYMFDFFPLLYPHNRVSVYSFYVGAAVVHARTFICWFQQHIVTVASLMWCFLLVLLLLAVKVTKNYSSFVLPSKKKYKTLCITKMIERIWCENCN